MHSGMHDALEALANLHEFGRQRGLASAAQYLYQEAEATEPETHLRDGLEDAALTVVNVCEYDIDDGWLIGDDANDPDVPYDLERFDTAGLDAIYAEGVNEGVADAVDAIRVYHDKQDRRDPDDERPDYGDGLVEAQRRVIARFGIDDPDPEWSRANAF